MTEHVSSCKREHPQGKYLIKGNPVVIYVLMVVMFVYVFFDCKCKSLNRLRENVKTNNKKTKKDILQHTTRPRMNISQVPAG